MPPASRIAFTDNYRTRTDKDRERKPADDKPGLSLSAARSSFNERDTESTPPQGMRLDFLTELFTQRNTTMKTETAVLTAAAAMMGIALLVSGCSSTRTVSTTGCGPSGSYYGGPSAASAQGTVTAGGASGQWGDSGHGYYAGAGGQAVYGGSGQYQTPQYSGEYSMPTASVQYETPQYSGQYATPSGNVQYQMPQYSGQYATPSGNVQYQMPQYSAQYATPSGATQHQVPSAAKRDCIPASEAHLYQGYVAVPQYSAYTGTGQYAGGGTAANQVYSGHTQQYGQPTGMVRRRGLGTRVYRVVNDR